MTDEKKTFYALMWDMNYAREQKIKRQREEAEAARAIVDMIPDNAPDQFYVVAGSDDTPYLFTRLDNGSWSIVLSDVPVFNDHGAAISLGIEEPAEQPEPATT